MKIFLLSEEPPQRRAGAVLLAAAPLLGLALGGLALGLALAACQTAGNARAYRAAAPQYYQPAPGALPWKITGELTTSATAAGSDEAVTIWIDNDVVAVGGFTIVQGQGDASFIGAYEGQMISVHCATVAGGSAGAGGGAGVTRATESGGAATAGGSADQARRAPDVACALAIGNDRAAMLRFTPIE